MFSSGQGLAYRVRVERINLLFAGTWSSVFTQFAVAAIFVVIQSAHSGWDSLAYWYAVLALVLLGRGLLERRYNQVKPTGDRLSIWRWWFRCGILFTSLLFGSTCLLYFPQDAVAYQVFTILLLAGMSAGALTVLVSDFTSFIIYVSLLMLPAVAVSASYGDNFHLGMALLVLAFYLLLLRSNQKMNALVKSSLVLRYENQELVHSLEKEKKRLDNRLGRILNDSSNEIYVVDAGSLFCLQVNVGATQNLGYSKEEMNEKDMLEILTQLDRPEFDKLVQPLFDGTQESVFYSGQHRRKDASTYDIEGRLQLSTEEEPPVFVATILDITERRESERKLLQQANFDQLTKLPNRYYMLHRIDNAFARAKRNKQMVGLLFIDLDNFKIINDTLGHNIGDELLKQAANRILSVLRASDTPARMGGDEFLVMLEDLCLADQAEVVARKLVRGFEMPFKVDSREVFTTASIGISIYPSDGESAELLMRHADTAMYQVKMNGRSHFQYFSQSMRAATEEQVMMETHLRRAMQNNELHILYQPMIDVRSGRIVGAEALLRWNSPELGFVPPDKFIHLAETIGLIQSIGNWVLTTACNEAKRWQSLREEMTHIAVNVSSHQFRAGKLLHEVDQVLQSTGLPAQALELEITESLLVQDTSEPLEILQALTERGIKLALDDFGTGYSSLSYLKRFPLQILKIDRSFVRDLAVDQNSEALVEAIVAMAHSLSLEVVAEGVESQAQFDFLQHRQVSFVQGYLFSKPVPAEEFRSMLERPALEPAAQAVWACRQQSQG